MRTTTIEILEDLFARYPALSCCKPDIKKSAESLIQAFQAGKKLLVCGNGGSAADSEHIVGELMKAFKLERRLDVTIQTTIREHYPDVAEELIENLQGAVPAISLVSETALMTAFGNDMSAQLVYAQQVLSYGQPGDVLLAITTSGNSSNVLHAARIAKIRRVQVIALTGEIGGKIKNLSDICICAPSKVTYLIQEYHLPIYHCLCACVENELFALE